MDSLKMKMAMNMAIQSLTVIHRLYNGWFILVCGFTLFWLVLIVVPEMRHSSSRIFREWEEKTAEAQTLSTMSVPQKTTSGHCSAARLERGYPHPHHHRLTMNLHRWSRESSLKDCRAKLWESPKKEKADRETLKTNFFDPSMLMAVSEIASAR